MEPTDFALEQLNREPSRYKIVLNRSDLACWHKAAFVEIIEKGVRKALDLSSANLSMGSLPVFNQLISLHNLLFCPVNTICECVLSSNPQGGDLAEIIAHILLLSIMLLSNRMDCRSEEYIKVTRVAKEMCICLSTALPNDLHILDETLSILFYSQMQPAMQNEHFKSDIQFLDHFQNELSYAVTVYVTKYCDDDKEKMGKKCAYDVSTWSAKKIKEMRKANSENVPDEELSKNTKYTKTKSTKIKTEKIKSEGTGGLN